MMFYFFRAFLVSFCRSVAPEFLRSFFSLFVKSCSKFNSKLLYLCTKCYSLALNELNSVWQQGFVMFKSSQVSQNVIQTLKELNCVPRGLKDKLLCSSVDFVRFNHICFDSWSVQNIIQLHWKKWILCDKRAEGQIALSEPLILSPYWSGTWNCCAGSSNDEKKRKIIYYHINYHIEDRIWIAAKIDCVDVLKMEGKAWTGTRFPAFNRINHFPSLDSILYLK